jgi:hypothetical protein
MAKSVRVVALTLGALPVLAIAQDLQCPTYAKALKDVLINASSSSSLQSIYDQHCQSNSSGSSTSAGIGLDAVVKAIPFKFTGTYGSSSEAMQNFCKTYQSIASSQQETNSYEYRVASKTHDTVIECLRLQSQGVTVSHSIASTQSSNFFLKSGVTQKIQVSGIHVSGDVKCEGATGGKTVAMTGATSLDVPKTLSFHCRRAAGSFNVAGKQVSGYAEGTITVLTNFGNYSMIWPREEVLSENLASVINSEVAQLKASLNAIQSKRPVWAEQSLSANALKKERLALGKTSDWLLWALSGTAEYRHGGNAGQTNCEVTREGDVWVLHAWGGQTDIGGAGTATMLCKAVGFRY